MTTEHQGNHHLPPPPPTAAAGSAITPNGDAYDAQNFSFAEVKPAVEKAAAAAEVGDDVREEEEDDDSSDGFEFAFAVRDPDDLPSSITADELFSGGRLLPAYPIFDRDLLFSVDAEASAEAAEKVENRVPLRRLFKKEVIELGSRPSSSEAPAAVDEAVVGDYCEWTPRSAPQSPERWKKSASTGMVPSSAASRRCSLRDLVIGRSRSDGKEKFVFVGSTPRPRTAAPSKEKTKALTDGAVKGGGRRRSSAETDMGTALRLYYGKGGAAAAAAGQGGGRRSFLPYRQELLGLFTNVNGLSWPHNRY